MCARTKQDGFSLTEVLLATGILAIGFVLIAMIFPAGIKLTSMAAEKTFAPVIAEEARSIIQLYELDPAKLPAAGPVSSVIFSAEYLTDQSLRYFYRTLINSSFDPINGTLPLEGDPQYVNLMSKINTRLAVDSLYPSLAKEYFVQNPAQKQRYGWAALCRRDPSAPQQVQIRLFICRRSEGLRYYGCRVAGTAITSEDANRPIPVPVRINAALGDKQVTIVDSGWSGYYPLQTCREFFLEGSWVIDDQFGFKYQVIKREGTTLTLNREWQIMGGGVIWVVPPAVGTSRNLCIEVL